jgi:hypothetical protein
MTDEIKTIFDSESSLQKTDHLSTAPSPAQHKEEREQYLVKNRGNKGLPLTRKTKGTKI